MYTEAVKAQKISNFYYFESRSKLESSQYVTNHWSNTRFEKMDGY